MALMGKIYELSFSVSLIGMAGYLVRKKKCRPIKLLSDASFFIYACHYCLIMKMANLMLTYLLPFESDIVFELKVLLRPAVTVGIGLLFFVTMKRICPKTLALLTGGRG